MKKEHFNLRTDNETKKKLYEIAKKENRTPTNWIENKIKEEYHKKSSPSK